MPQSWSPLPPYGKSFDRLRNAELHLSPELMDTIMAATGACGKCSASCPRVQPQSADPGVLGALHAALGEGSAAALRPSRSGSAAASPVFCCRPGGDPD